LDVSVTYLFFDFLLENKPIFFTSQEFYIFPDGTYIYGHDGIEELYGEAYLLKDKIFQKINTNDQIISL